MLNRRYSRAARARTAQPEHDVARPAARHVQHRQEQPEQQQRRAEVVLQDQISMSASADHQQQRRQIRQRRQPERPDPQLGQA